MISYFRYDVELGLGAALVNILLFICFTGMVLEDVVGIRLLLDVKSTGHALLFELLRYNINIAHLDAVLEELGVRLFYVQVFVEELEQSLVVFYVVSVSRTFDLEDHWPCKLVCEVLTVSHAYHRVLVAGALTTSLRPHELLPPVLHLTR